jgi:hypothetical protein
MSQIDFISVLFASVIYLMLYFVWYSKFLFGKFYQHIIRKINGKALYYYFLVFIFMFLISYFIALFEILLKISTFWDGVFFGFIIWLGFVLTHEVLSVMAYKRSVKLFLLDNLLYLLGLMIVGGIIAG